MGSVRMWKIICIVWWVIPVMSAIWTFTTHKGKGLLIIVFFLIFIIICLHIFASIKALYTANIIILIIIFGCIGCYLFEWDAIFVMGMCFGFGLGAVYALKFKQLNK